MHTGFTRISLTSLLLRARVTWQKMDAARAVRLFCRKLCALTL